MKYLKKIEVTTKENKKIEMNVFDFDLISKSKEDLILLISARREYGKSLGAKIFALDRFINYGEKSLWVRNTIDEIEEEMSNFLIDWVDHDERAYDIDIKNGRGYYKNELFFVFKALSTSMNKKGSRIPVSSIFWDEFELLPVQGREKMVSRWNNLINTHRGIHPAKKYLMGNNQSLYHPVMVKLKILEISSEISHHKNLVLILFPIPKKSEIEKKFKGDSDYELAKLMGESDHIYLNESLYNTLNGIVDLQFFEMKKDFGIFKIKGDYFKMGSIDSIYYMWIYEKAIKSTDIIKTLTIKDTDHGDIYKDVIDILYTKFFNHKMYFGDIASKYAIISLF